MPRAGRAGSWRDTEVLAAAGTTFGRAGDHLRHPDPRPGVVGFTRRARAGRGGTTGLAEPQPGRPTDRRGRGRPPSEPDPARLDAADIGAVPRRDRPVGARVHGLCDGPGPRSDLRPDVRGRPRARCLQRGLRPARAGPRRARRRRPGRPVHPGLHRAPDPGRRGRQGVRPDDPHPRGRGHGGRVGDPVRPRAADHRDHRPRVLAGPADDVREPVPDHVLHAGDLRRVDRPRRDPRGQRPVLRLRPGPAPVQRRDRRRDGAPVRPARDLCRGGGSLRGGAGPPRRPAHRHLPDAVPAASRASRSGPRGSASSSG